MYKITDLLTVKFSEKERIAFRYRLLLVGLLTALVSANAYAQTAKKPNILFIVTDDMRTELNCYGTTYIRSPHIDQLAAQGTLFRSAYVQQAVCAASRASFLSGTRPNTTGVDYPYSEYFVNTFWPAHPTIAEFFDREQYAVRTFGKIHHGGLPDKVRAQHIAGDYAQHYVLPENLKVAGKNGRSKDSPPFEAGNVGDEGYQDGFLAGKAVEAIKELAGKDAPFFIAVGFRKPHLPFCAPKKYWDLYNEADLKLAKNPQLPQGAPEYAVAAQELNSYKTPQKINGQYPEAFQRRLKHAYAACISYVDAQVGKLVDQLEKSGVADNTIIVFLSDHGWHLGEQSAWGKSTNFENSTHAPLIIRVPGKANGVVISQLVEFVDVYPTLVELAGFQPADYLEGTSMVPLLDNPKRKWKSAAFHQFPRSNGIEGFGIKTSSFRYVEWRREENDSVVARELYSQLRDPFETINLAADKRYADKVTELSARLKAGWKAALPEGITNLSNNQKAPPAVGWGPEARKLKEKEMSENKKKN